MADLASARPFATMGGNEARPIPGPTLQGHIVDARGGPLAQGQVELSKLTRCEPRDRGEV